MFDNCYILYFSDPAFTESPAYFSSEPPCPAVRPSGEDIPPYYILSCPEGKYKVKKGESAPEIPLFY
jgi:hypothetical protein